MAEELESKASLDGQMTCSEILAAINKGPMDEQEQEANGGLECRLCGCLGLTPAGCDPTTLCNECAHDAVDVLARVIVEGNIDARAWVASWRVTVIAGLGSSTIRSELPESEPLARAADAERRVTT